MRPGFHLFIIAAFAGFLCNPVAAIGSGLQIPAEPELTELAEDVQSGRVFLGMGRLFTNDQFGDGEDRWRSGSLQFSLLWGPDGLAGRPEGFGDLIELRFGGAVIAPSNLTVPSPTDRRYAGILSLGAHSHFTTGGVELSLGADLVATGPQTGIGRFHTRVHDMLGMLPPSAAVLAAQIPNGFHPTLLAEAGRPVVLSERLTLRVFAEGQAGVETFLRLGGDLLIGPAWHSGVWLRDASSGQLYQSARAPQPGGVSFLLGADVAKVFSSTYLPAPAFALTPVRARVRAGALWQGEKASAFYGLTWLGREFQAQPKGQIVGSLRLNWQF